LPQRAFQRFRRVDTTMTIARIALPVALDRNFDYWIPDGPAIARGAIVRVRLARRSLIGVVVDVVTESDVSRERVQPIDEIVALPPLSDDVMTLAEFVADYYQQPFGMAVALAVPPLGKRNTTTRATIVALALTVQGRASLPARLVRAPAAQRLFARLAAAETGLSVGDIHALPPHLRQTLRRWQADGDLAPAMLQAVAPSAQLNGDQQSAVDASDGASGIFTTFLLQGVTGSGKTDVYLAAADAAIAKGGQVLMLVPEINLTPQLEMRVRAALPRARAVTLHSGLADGERRSHWQAAARGDADLVLGTRLSVYCALPRLALVVVDEEHDASYKQQDGVRYHARDVAVWRARSRGVPIVLGSATPSLESYAQAHAGRYRRLTLLRRADPRATLPRLALVGNRGAGAHDGIAGPLWDALRSCLARGEQGLVFVNRRGFSPSLKCGACMWNAECPRCSARLTVHREPPSLRCHHCGHVEALPRACPQCGNVDLLPLGYGTQRLERALAAAFPRARIARVDRDSTRAKGAFAAIRAEVAIDAIDLLIGTQMLAKGHDFPRLTLVGVLGADNALYSADFRATERLAALLIQVAGRAGRAGLPGEVVVQTDFPTHPVYEALKTHDYDRLAQQLIAEREAAQLPPATHVALLFAEAHRRDDVDAFLGRAHAAAEALLRPDGDVVTVFAPVPALLSRRAGMERGQLVVQSARRRALHEFLSRWREALAVLSTARVRVALDVDPASFG
jgi:primosomal protein N' (replication factor Y) (superfamily II helicase)